MKRMLCLLVCGLVILSPLAMAEGEASPAAVADDGETIIAEKARPAFVEQLLSVAREELGYTEDANNRTKYGAWAGDPYAAWCAEFVCWCVDQTDVRFGTELLDVIYPNYTGQNTGRDWLVRRGRFLFRKANCPGWGYQWLKGATERLEKDEFIPRSGDLVFFTYSDAGDTEHVALVEYCARDAQGKVLVHVIEGNNPAAVQRNSYRLDNSQILGFGVCEDIIGTTMRFGNKGDKVLALQQDLNFLGLLEERNVTGEFGSNTRAAVSAYQRERMTGQEANGVADMATQQAIAAEMEWIRFYDPNNWLVME